MSIVNKPYTFPLTSPVILSTEVNADFDILYNDYNGNITNANVAASAGITYDKLVPMSGDGTITAGGVLTITGSSSGLLPVGTIQAFYDFGGLVTFNTAIWRYCDGSVLVYPGSPLNGQTLPDFSGRYPVGFGTDGGGDIGTSPWATAAVGNVNHQINIQHNHTGPSHTHTTPLHDHTTGDHVLDISEIPIHDHIFTWYTVPGGIPGPVGIATNDGPNTSVTNSAGGGLAHNHGTTGTAAPTTNPGGTGNTGDALSTTQSIQPHSIRVRYIIKVI